VCGWAGRRGLRGRGCARVEVWLDGGGAGGKWRGPRQRMGAQAKGKRNNPLVKRGRRSMRGRAATVRIARAAGPATAAVAAVLLLSLTTVLRLSEILTR
jgi:hypothetical protein